MWSWKRRACSGHFPDFSRIVCAKLAPGLILGCKAPCRGDPAMNEPHDPNRTVDDPPAPADSLDAGLAAGFGRPAEAPRSSLGDQRPVLLKEAEGESDHVVKPNSDAMPPQERDGRPLPAVRRDRPRRHGRGPARPRRRPGPRPGRQGAAGEARRPARGGAAVPRGGADRRAVAAPRRRARLRHRPLRRPALLHHEAGQGPDPGRRCWRERADAGGRTGRASWAIVLQVARRWRTPTPRG